MIPIRMACGLKHIIYNLCIMSLLAPSPYGEKFFLDRSHQDQSRYEADTKVYAVKNAEEALQQLEKYGYLLCTLSRRKKRRALLPGDIHESHPSDSRNGEVPGLQSPEEGGFDKECNTTQVEEGIKRYQSKYRLNETGVLDAETYRLMSISRCGNKDSEKRVENPNVEEPSVSPKPVGERRSKRSNGPVVEGGLSEKFPRTRRLWRRSPGDSKLMKVIAPRPLSKGVERRLKFLEYLKKIQVEEPLSLDRGDELERSKRSVVVDHKTGLEQMFQKQRLKWRLLNTGYSNRIPVADQETTIDLAFRMWSEVIPLEFNQDRTGDIKEIDIEISFGTRRHQNCPHTFDGSGGEIAHSWHAGNVHFDDEENYKSTKTYTVDGIYLLRVAVHEIGHVLGLTHTNKAWSVMFAIYSETYAPDPDFELGWEDRKEIQKIYGVCKGSFDTVFDWVRRATTGNRDYIFNTYFFRQNRYWMYENHANRTRYGDPGATAEEWKNVPLSVDGYIHVWFYDKSTDNLVDSQFFFKGEHYYEYDRVLDQVAEGWPRLISEDFYAKNSSSESIPNNLDTVFFDFRDNNIYFFKGELVYVFDPVESEEEWGCCVRKIPIQEEFPAKPGHKPLPSGLDAVYYSYSDKCQYFFKGEEAWKNELYYAKDKELNNRVIYLGKWYNHWFDICDVTEQS